MIATICRVAHFNAAHRLHVKEWSDEKNQITFGKCNNKNYHGHNYTLTVKVTGEIDATTGYIMDTKLLKHIIETKVEEPYDHKNLNLDVPDFEDLNPTVENIAVVIHKNIKKQLPINLQLTIILHETERNFVEYSGQ
ncbi:MAG: 6-carboxytetrahydropterin synthase [Bacteroidetes bacterium]|nr:6-carboxytetrahydropterin synthase [Bacteroidota bacterium]